MDGPLWGGCLEEWSPLLCCGPNNTPALPPNWVLRFPSSTVDSQESSEIHPSFCCCFFLEPSNFLLITSRLIFTPDRPHVPGLNFRHGNLLRQPPAPVLPFTPICPSSPIPSDTFRGESTGQRTVPGKQPAVAPVSNDDGTERWRRSTPALGGSALWQRSCSGPRLVPASGG